MKTVIITLFLAVSAYSQTAAIINAMGDLHIPGSYYGDGSHLTGITASGSGDPAGYTTVTYSATPVFAVTKNTGQAFLITLTGNVTSSTITTSGVTSSGRTITTFRICQDGPGSHSFVWPTNVQNHGTIDATSSACSTQNFWFDGTDFQALGPLFVTGATPSLIIPGSSSGATTLQATAAASGVLTLPARTSTLATTSGSVTAGNCGQWDSFGNIVDSGAACGGGSSTPNAVVVTNTTDLSNPGGFANTYFTWNTNATVSGTGAALHSTSVNPSHFTADATGVYSFAYNWVSTTSTDTVLVLKNGSPFVLLEPSASNYKSGTLTLPLTITDYLEFGVTSSAMSTGDHTRCNIVFTKLF